MNRKTLILLIYLIIIFGSCSTKTNNELTKNNISILQDSLPVFLINQDSLTILTPGKNGIDLPKVIKSGLPKIVPANKNVVSAGIPTILIAGNPNASTPGIDSFLIPNIIPAIHNPVRAGISEVVIVKDPDIRDRNPQNFIFYGKYQGLKHSTVRCIMQDKMGNLWFGTNGGGASKYDGKTFTHYTEKEGLCNNDINSIIEDRSGNIWFGTSGGGISKYNGKTFTNFTEKEGLSNIVVNAILEDHNANIWFCTSGGGINKFDGKNFTHYTKKQGLTDNNVLSIAEDRNGNIWFGTEGGGVSKFDGKSFYHFTHKEGLSNSKVLSIKDDRNGNLWFGTEGDGVLKFDGKYFTHFTKKQGLANDNVMSIAEDRNGNIWFGTDGGGASKFDGKQFTHFAENEGLWKTSIYVIFPDKNGTLWFGTAGGVSKFLGTAFSHYAQADGVSNNGVYSIIEDHNNNIWFGTWGSGIIKFDGKSFSHFTEDVGLPSNNGRAIIQDHKGNFWFGSTGKGITKYDGKLFTHFTDKTGLLNNTIRAILEDRHGNLWFGTDMGVCKFDGVSFTHFTEKEGLSNNIVAAITEDHLGNLWFGTLGGGACKFNGSSFTHFTVEQGLANNDVYSIIEDPKGNLWFGTGGGGLTIVQVNSKSKNKELKRSETQSITANEWEILSLTEQDGLIGNSIFSMLIDEEGDMIIGTRFGLSVINAKMVENIDSLFQKAHDPSVPIFKNFGYDEGFLGFGVNGGNTLCQGKDGTIWVGANNWLTAYHPQGILADSISPNIHLTSIEIFNEAIPWSKLADFKGDEPDNNGHFQIAKDTSVVLGNGIALQNFEFTGITPNYGLPENLSLAYNNNYLTLNYIGITQQQANKVKYQYKLEGLDINWSAITNRTSVPYGNLTDGEYTFKVKAMNSDGYWSNEYTYSFTIRAPWWKTYWFYIILGIFIASSFIGFYRWRLANILSQKKQLEQTVKEKTSEVMLQKEELETSLNNLQQAQKQLVQSEKMASLGILAAGVAHEINNPLNFINGGITAIDTYFRENLQDHYNNVDLLISGIKAGVIRATNIVTSLNHYSRVDPYKTIITDIHPTIDNCLVILNNQIKSNVQVFKQYLAKDYELVANEGQINQVLLNVFTNAVHAIKENGLIRIKTHIEGQNILISIEDNGCGISEENLSKIFDPFFTTKDPGQGTGLGMSISLKIIDDHKGKIEYKSKVNIGTEVIINLPINESNNKGFISSK